LTSTMSECRRNKLGAIKFTQPVFLQSIGDEFKCKAGKVMVPAKAGGMLVKKCNRDKAAYKGEQTHYISGVGKLLI